MSSLSRRFFSGRNVLIVLAVFLIAGIFATVGQYYNVAQWLRDTFNSLVGYNQALAAFVFIALGALSAIFTFFTSTPLVPIAAVIWGKGMALFMLFGGWILGAIIAYHIGHLFAHVISGFKVFEKIESHRQQLGKKSEFLLVLLFRLAVPSEVASYTLGTLRYPFGRYVLATVISDFPFAVLAIYSSAALFGPHPLVFALCMIGGLIAITLFTYLFHRYLKKLRGIDLDE